MTVTISPTGTIALTGVCPVEEADVLLQYLLAKPDAPIDWSACESAHSAVIQVLLVAKATLQGSPRGLFLKDHIGPSLLERAGT